MHKCRYCEKGDMIPTQQVLAKNNHWVHTCDDCHRTDVYYLETFFEEGEEPSKDQCPLCGYWADEYTLIETKEYATTSNPSDPMGAADWVEVHKCGNCGNTFEYDDCNY